MVFSSLLFLFRFFPAVLFLYFLTPARFKNAVLFAASLFFYAFGEPVYVLIMLFSTLVDYSHGRLLERFMKEGKQKAARRAVLSSVAINLSLLGFFKYSDFFIGIINQVFHMDIPLLPLTLPIGISFYTFQTMSYTIDVYRKEAKVQKNIIAFGAYVAMFPQLIAGPIVQYKTIADELDHRKESVSLFSEGAGQFVAGLAKKVLLANNIGLVFDSVKASPVSEMSVLTAWLGIISFAFQIYFDFSGYSDMAVGLGRMFGFHFPENFDYPYLSKSITEFWRRWHMTLGAWFREYVYIPLGGNRRGPLKQIRNIFVVWLLTGFWHGASFNFLLWGVYYACFLILEKLFLLKKLAKAPPFLSHLYTMLVVLFGWALFAFESLKDGAAYFSYLIGAAGIPMVNGSFVYLLSGNFILLVLLVIGSTDYPKKMAAKLAKSIKREGVFIALENAGILILLFLCVAYLVDATYNPFLYFRF